MYFTTSTHLHIINTLSCLRNSITGRSIKVMATNNSRRKDTHAYTHTYTHIHAQIHAGISTYTSTQINTHYMVLMTNDYLSKNKAFVVIF